MVVSACANIAYGSFNKTFWQSVSYVFVTGGLRSAEATDSILIPWAWHVHIPFATDEWALSLLPEIAYDVCFAHMIVRLQIF